MGDIWNLSGCNSTGTHSILIQPLSEAGQMVECLFTY